MIKKKIHNPIFWGHEYDSIILYYDFFDIAKYEILFIEEKIYDIE